MVHAQVLYAYINFVLIYTADHIFPVLPIKYLINEYRDPTMPFKLTTSKKPSISHLRVLFFPCVLRKYTAHVGTKALNMRHQAQNIICGIFVGIPQHQKGYLVYVPHKRNIVSSHDVVFDEILYSALVYTSQPYSEGMVMRPAVPYILYATSSK